MSAPPAVISAKYLEMSENGMEKTPLLLGTFLPLASVLTPQGLCSSTIFCPVFGSVYVPSTL